jgi:hypothetical protein
MCLGGIIYIQIEKCRGQDRTLWHPCLQDNSSARTTQKTQPLYCWGGVLAAPFHSNGRGTDHIENTALLLLRAFVSVGTCLLSRCLETVCNNPVVLLSLACVLLALHIHRLATSMYAIIFKMGSSCLAQKLHSINRDEFLSQWKADASFLFLISASAEKRAKQYIFFIFHRSVFIIKVN